MWDLTTGRLTAGSTGAASGLNTIEFHPGQPELLAIGGTDGQIRFYDVAADENVQAPMAALGERIVDLEFNADGSVLVGVSASGLVGVWKAPSGRTPTARLAGVDDPAWHVVGRRLLVHEEDSWSVIDSRDPGGAGVPIVFDVRGPDGAAHSTTATMSADGSTVVAQTSSASGVSTLVTDVDLNGRWELPEPVSPVALSPDGTHLLAVDSLHQRLSVWDLAARTRVATEDISELGLDATAFAGVVAPDGKTVLLGSPARIVRTTILGLDVVASAGNPLGSVTSLSAIPGTDDVIVSGGAGEAGRLARVDLETGHTEATTEPHGRESLVNLVVSADGSVVVAQEVDSGRYEVFDARSLDSITGPLPGTGPVAVDTPAPFVSADGGTLVTPASARRLVVRDIDPRSWEASACAVAGRNLTRAEWNEFIGSDDPYEPTCRASGAR